MTQINKKSNNGGPGVHHETCKDRPFPVLGRSMLQAPRQELVSKDFLINMQTISSQELHEEMELP